MRRVICLTESATCSRCFEVMLTLKVGFVDVYRSFCGVWLPLALVGAKSRAVGKLTLVLWEVVGGTTSAKGILGALSTAVLTTKLVRH